MRDLRDLPGLFASNTLEMYFGASTVYDYAVLGLRCIECMINASKSVLY